MRGLCRCRGAKVSTSVRRARLYRGIEALSGKEALAEFSSGVTTGWDVRCSVRGQVGDSRPWIISVDVLPLVNQVVPHFAVRVSCFAAGCPSGRTPVEVLHPLHRL